MNNYSEQLKESMVIKLCAPNAPSVYQLSKQTGIHRSTLQAWKSKYGNTKVMSKEQKNPKKWIPEEKIKVVAESLTLKGEEELGAFLRRKGIHSIQLEEWKAEAFGAFTESNKKGRGRPKKDNAVANLEKENRMLKKDLLRKEKALAESAALLWLKKRAHEIWGEKEEEE